VKNRHYVIFAIILVALVVIYVVQRQSNRITTMETGYVMLFPDLKTDSVTKIKAYQKSFPESELSLVRQGEGWVIANRYNAPAVGDHVASLLKDLGGLKGELRSSAADNLPTFWLADDEAVHLELYGPDNKMEADLLFGKKGQTGETTFVRKAGEDKVYSALIRLNSIFQIWDKSQPLDLRNWLELRLINIKDWSKAKRVEFQFPDAPMVVFEKYPAQPQGQNSENKAVWKKVEPADTPQPRSDDIVKVITALATMRGEDVLDPSKIKEYGLDSAPYRAILTMEDGVSYEVLLAPQGNNGYFGTLQDSKVIYFVAPEAFTRTFGKAKKLLGGETESSPEQAPPQK